MHRLYIAATSLAARVLGLAGETGSIEPDMRADLVAVRGRPLEDLRVLSRPAFVMRNGDIALDENLEAPFGTYSVVDVSDPENPVEVKRITQADGLGRTPMTSEFTPDGQFAYLITNGSPTFAGSVDVLDLDSLVIVKKIELPENCRPHTGDFSNDGKFFFLNCSGTDEVAVISNAEQVVVQQVALSGDTPRGVITR